MRSKEYHNAAGVRINCTKKTTFGFENDPPEKAFVCRDHKKPEFHGLYKGDQGYVPEVMMPPLRYICRASAGAPTISLTGEKMSAAERSARSRAQWDDTFQLSFH